jgi:S1-C subfamily serine protease
MPGGKGLVKYGFTVQDMPRQFVSRIGEAVVVDYVDPLSPAANGSEGEGGLQLNDVIFLVDDTPTPSVQAFDKAIQRAGPTVRLGVQRGIRRGYIDIVRRSK